MVEAPEYRASTSTMDGTTNTLIITRVPPALLHPSVTPSLREFFERFGHIEAWVPLSAFDRVVVIYTHEHAAEAAKAAMDCTLVEGFGSVDGDVSKSLLRVYRGIATPIDIVRNRRLQDRLPVPDTDKNFLISPPGSPPVGWEQIREDAPNLETLADDLVKALESLSVDRATGSEDNDGFVEDLASPTSPTQRDTVIIPHRRTPSGDLPSVMVSDTDVDVPSSPSRSSNTLSIAEAFGIQRRASASQGRAPGPIGHVKATVDSMQGSSQFPQIGQRIDRTPRPPVG